MTTAEYEAKYGTKPGVPVTTAPAAPVKTSTTTPPVANAPVKMTAEEFKAKYGVPPAVPPAEPGVVQSVVQGVASPFLKAASSVRDIYDTSKQIIKTIPAAAKDAIDLAKGTPEERAAFIQQAKQTQPAPAKEYDYGYFGKQKPIGSTANILKSPLAPENVTAIKDAVGTGAEIASYIPAGGAVATTGKSILARTLPRILPLAAEGATAGGLQGFGSALQKDKGVVDTAIDTAGGTVAGGVLAPATGLPLGALGRGISKQIGKIVDPEREYRASVIGNINKALGTLKTGGTLGSIPRTNEKKIQAFEILHDLAPSITYKKHGEDVVFDPKNASFEDLALALPKAKEQVYGVINAAKKEATGQGVQVNLVKAHDAVNEIAANASLGTSRTNAEKLSDDLARIMDKDGNTTIEKANQFAKDLNTRLSGLFNGTSDNLSREQEAMVSKEITDAIDHSMGTIFDTRFKALQGKYSALKTIEDDVNRQYRKEIRQLDGVPQFIKDYGSAEIISGIINTAMTGNPTGLAKGLILKIAGNRFAEMRKPSTYLKKVFKDVGNFKSKGIAPDAAAEVKTGFPKKKVIDTANKQAYGAVAGIQQDDQGNVTFDPKMAVAGVAAGSLAKNFPKKALIEGAGKVFNALREGQLPIGRGSMKDTVARERFDIPNLPKVSFGGSDRDVYDLGDGKVLKVLKTARGIRQNDYSSDYYAEGAGLIPNTIEEGKNYVVKEKVNPPDTNTKKMVDELKKLDVTALVGKMGGFDKHQSEVEKAVQIMEKYGYSGSDFQNYNPLWGDVSAVRNWGTTAEGKPILLDEGTLNGELVLGHQTGGRNMSDPEFRDIYNQSRAAKKKFGDKDAKTMYGIGGAALLGATAAGSQKASAQENKNPEEVKQVGTSLDSVYKDAEKIAPMINKDYIRTLVQRESSGGTNDQNRNSDHGNYGWVVGFTKPTYQNIVKKAETSQKYKNLISSMPGFDTPEDAIRSALIYSTFLLRDHTKEQTTGKREYKKINAAELYKLYNGNGSPEGVKAFEKEFGNLAANFPKKA